jgi:hypothetical protein
MRFPSILLVALVVLPAMLFAVWSISTYLDELLDPCFQWSMGSTGSITLPPHAKPGDPCGGSYKGSPKSQRSVGGVIRPTNEPEGGERMRAQQINRACTMGLIVLSLTALLDVLLLGYTQPPLTDEGTGAHIFQLVMVALVPTGLLFLATADWKQPVRTVRLMAFPAAVIVLAFAALYYLEHHFYPAHYPGQYR